MKFGEGHDRAVRVAIAGGGIGGMALALSLHAAGFRNVDVYESATRVRGARGRDQRAPAPRSLRHRPRRHRPLGGR